MHLVFSYISEALKKKKQNKAKQNPNPACVELERKKNTALQASRLDLKWKCKLLVSLV